jgi:CheY-like chemotaxis protein
MSSELATVLVVEDDSIIRMDIVDCLEEAGLAVLEAADADQAIQILENRNDIRLVFTDVDMPGSMDGLKLAAAIHDRWPPVAIIVASGQVMPKASQIPEGGRFFRKPYDRPEIVDAVRKMVKL